MYLYEFFSWESRFLQRTAEELRTQALSNIKFLAKERGTWTAPSTEAFVHEEIKIIKSQACLWVSELFTGLSSGENPCEDTIQIDFNEVYQSPDVLPKISMLLHVLRRRLEDDIQKLMKTGLTEKMSADSKSDVTSSLNDIRLALAKINILKGYEDQWNSLFTQVARGMGVSLLSKKAETNAPPETGSRIV